ncbi:MAG: hypothetical protein HFE46_01795 [Clostridia bacterium]|jgi:hypothetical protein|nr:hypothetical protein [Clostridia bacterium]
MNGINGTEDTTGALGATGGLTAGNLAWLLFAQTGMPGLYMLYSDLERGEERSIFD